MKDSTMRGNHYKKLAGTEFGLIFLWAVAASFSSLVAEDWPHFLGPRSKGVSSETGLLDRWPADGPELVWDKEVGTGYSAPSIRGDRLVLHHRVQGREIIECFQKATGESLWKLAYPSGFRDPYGYNNGPRATPWLTQNRCFAFGAEGRLVCVDLATGKKIWERDTQKDWNVPSAFFGVGSSPVLAGETLLVMAGGQPNAGMVGLDPHTGQTLWESVGRDVWDGKPKLGWRGEPLVQWKGWEKQASYATPVIADLGGETAAVCLMRQGLVSLDPVSGRVNFARWFRARVNESVNAANPVAVGDRVFFSAAYYNIGSVMLEVSSSGDRFKEIWTDDVLEIHWATPIYLDGYLYAFSGRNEPDARFRCVEFNTGKLVWDRDESWRKYSTKQPDRYGRGSAILADGKLIVLGEGGLLGLFEATPTEPKELGRWQVPQLNYPCWTAPVLSDGKLYLRSENRLLCFHVRKSGSN